MGTKYSSISVTGYNASPPADDASQVDSNKVEWQKHLDKIGAPLKTAVEAMDAALLLALNTAPVSKSSTYSVVAGDHLKTIECTGTFTVTLLPVATAGTGFTVVVKNVGSGTITVEGAGSETIDGALNVALAQYDSVTIQVDAAVSGNMILSNYDSTSFTAADEAKLDGIEALADVTDTANVTAAGALMDSEVDADIKTLALPANTTISAFGASLVDDANAAAGRSTLGAAASGANSDITSLTGLTTDLAVPHGGTGAGTFTDGGVLIGNGTSAVQSTSAGTSGQILTSNGAGVDPTFQDSAYSVATGLRVLIDTYTASASANISCVSDITSTYDEYIIEIRDLVPATNAVQLYMVISSNNGSSYLTASGYYYTRNELSAATETPAEGINGGSYGLTGALVSNTASRGGVNGTIRLHNPLPSAVHQFDANLTHAGTTSASKLIRVDSMCAYDANVVCNAVQFQFSSGNIASGTIKVYGIKK